SGAGNDNLTGTIGSNIINGGNGNDTVDYSWIASGFESANIVINLNSGYSDTGGTEGLANLENVLGTQSGETIIGNGSDNVLHGNSGNDTIDAGDGVDNVYGDDGDDLLNGGFGWDTLINGGNGSDTVDYSWISSGFDTAHIVIDLTAGSYTDDFGTESLVSIENVWGTQSSETINGTAGNNLLAGNDGNDVLNGGAGNDTLNGGNGNDTINAGAVSDGQDSVDGGEGDDVITSSGWGTYTGGNGNDYVYAGLGTSETLDGGADTDTIDTTLYTGNYVLDLGTGATNFPPESYVNFENAVTGLGNDDVTGTSGANMISTGDGNDVITGGAGDDTLNGGAGNDTINAGANSDGADTVDGGDGNDVITSSGQGTVTGGNGDDYVYAGLGTFETLDGGAGTDTLDTTLWNDSYSVDLSTGVTNYSPESFINFENVVTGDGNDTVSGTSGDNSIWTGLGTDSISGGAGNDWIDGGAGADTMAGNAGNDTYVVDDAGDLITESGGQGTDLVYSGISYTLTGNVENLTLMGSANINGNGNSGNNTITGNDGNNSINGGTGADTMSGGIGDDTYYLDNSGDKIIEGNVTGVDLVFASVSYSAAGQYIENVTLTGAANIDATGNGLDNTLRGNTGNNTLDGGTGADTLIGGTGNDTYFVDNAGDTVTEASGGGTDVVNTKVAFDVGAQYIEVVNLTGGANAAIYGSTSSRSETLNGNLGNNLLDGRNGADTMAGGAGNDTYMVDNAGDLVTENAAEGTDTVRSFLSYILTANVENLELQGASNINGTGNTSDNLIFGNTGNNRLFGLDGNDALDGGLGVDTMTGGLGNDTFTVDNVGDVIVENVGEGTDTVRTDLSYILGANIENLVLVGSSNVNGTG
ncbi:MAG: hypothetical protein JF615_07580, partial [Asticcacaulis sp.]|nr:hypothetical protein [Asticcacaulis sp.]